MGAYYFSKSPSTSKYPTARTWCCRLRKRCGRWATSVRRWFTAQVWMKSRSTQPRRWPGACCLPVSRPVWLSPQASSTAGRSRHLPSQAPPPSDGRPLTAFCAPWHCRRRRHGCWRATALSDVRQRGAQSCATRQRAPRGPLFASSARQAERLFSAIDYMRSKIAAMPCPPPMHIVTRA